MLAKIWLLDVSKCRIQVIDLGVDISEKQFLKAVKETRMPLSSAFLLCLPLHCLKCNRS